MKMIGALKYDLTDKSELEEKKIQKELGLMNEIIKSSLQNHLDFVDTDVKSDTILCEVVPGFFPYSHNKGGHTVSGCVLGLESSLSNINDEIAIEKINVMIADGYKVVRQELYSEKKEEIQNKGIFSYADFEEFMKNNSEYDDAFNEKYDIYIDDEFVKFELRVLFHGLDTDQYHFTVDSQINWEFPYFRDGKGCSVYRQKEIYVKDSSELNVALVGALTEVKSLFKK